MRSHCIFASLLGAGLALLISLPSSAEEAASKEKIDKLIDQLGSGSFAEREKASRELAGIGVPALDALRKAAKSEDAEVRKRAEDILPKIERQAESARVLVPKRVHLVYKDMPLAEALADFQKKSGYHIELHDPDGKLKERKVTLDTGETSFWHALGLFCDKAQLAEASMEDLMQAPQAPGGAPGAPLPAQPVIVRPGRAFLPGNMPSIFGRNGQLILKDSKAKALPTDDRSAVRIRVLGKSDPLGNVPEGEVNLALEVSLEPKLQWQMFQSVHIDKAVDDQDQKLTQVVPQVEGPAAGAVGNPAIAPPGGPAGIKIQMQMQRMQMMGRQQMGWGGPNQQVPVQLKKGAKAAKSLKELQGVLTVQLLTEARPVITADKLDKAAGKSFKGDEGGSIKIMDVKSEEDQTSIQLELEQPPFDKVMPAQSNVVPGGGVRIMAPRGLQQPPPPPKPPEAGKGAQPPAVQQPAVQPPPPAPPAAQPPAAQRVRFPLGGPPGGGPAQLMDSMNGMSIQDDKGNVLPIDGRRSRASISFVQQANGPPKQTLTWTLVCPHEKDKGKPAKVVYLGRKSVSVEVPFALKDVPLP